MDTSTFIDWNSNLLSSMRIDLEDCADEAVSVLTYLQTEWQITKHCMMPILDVSKTPVSVFLIKRASYERCLAQVLPREIQIRYSARLLLQQDLWQTPDLERLTNACNGYLPIVFPPGEYREWMDKELNQLLYKRKLKLLLTSCEKFPSLYSNEVAEKLFRIPNAVYQFHYAALSDARLRRVIYNLYQLKKTVLFGTSVNSLLKAYRLDFDFYQSEASTLFSKPDLYRLFRAASKFWDD